ncbi:MAG: hypothetical protein JJU29_05550 [Verrucomicrobia bacterium]|nr:hypothetical protein [Verrucomicrobiota bacterium]MCH8512688.1 hypothetical protein [Kiritimatiellia bacterium]
MSDLLLAKGIPCHIPGGRQDLIAQGHLKFKDRGMNLTAMKFFRGVHLRVPEGVPSFGERVVMGDHAESRTPHPFYMLI